MHNSFAFEANWSNQLYHHDIIPCTSFFLALIDSPWVGLPLCLDTYRLTVWVRCRNKWPEEERKTKFSWRHKASNVQSHKVLNKCPPLDWSETDEAFNGSEVSLHVCNVYVHACLSAHMLLTLDWCYISWSKDCFLSALSFADLQRKQIVMQSINKLEKHLLDKTELRTARKMFHVSVLHIFTFC